MWSDLPTIEKCLDCRPPFSFYFDLIGAYWKSDAASPASLHRLCTLARKQWVTHVLVESAVQRADVREEIDALDQWRGGGGSAEAVALSFFASERAAGEIADVEETSIIGHVVLINYRAATDSRFSDSYIYEGLFRAPSLPNSASTPQSLLNNFVCCEGRFDRKIKGRDFVVRGVYYCQQNGQTHVCAHASLRMTLNTLGTGAFVTNASINSLLAIKPPFSGLSISQIQTAINAYGGVTACVADCTNLSAATYLSILSSIVESGHIALLIFSTAQNIQHVVAVFGHTRNSDEWHPQAVPAYAGPQSARYYPGSAWIDHFLIHDDNFGPYYSLSSRALEVDPQVKAQFIIALHPDGVPNMVASYAETIAAIMLTNWFPSLGSLSSNRWYQYMIKNKSSYVLRTILIARSTYTEHLRNMKDHDGNANDPSEIANFGALPERFWMIEISVPYLFTGNRTKLGELLLDAQQAVNPADLNGIFLAMRLPGLLLVKDAAGDVQHRDLGVCAHVPMFQCRVHDQVW
jgi:hypothetical protein